MGKLDEFSGTFTVNTMHAGSINIKPPDTMVVDLGHSSDIRRQYHGIKHIKLIYDGAEHVYDSADFMLVGDEGWFRGWDDIAEWTEEDGSVHKGYVLDPIFRFCPSCGYRVKTEAPSHGHDAD